MSNVSGNEWDESPVNVAGDAVGVLESNKTSQQESPKMWFVAYVGTCMEKAVRDRLKMKGYNAYAATQWELRVRNSGRRVRIERPIITHYVFVRVTEEERKVIVEFPYIHSFLTDKATEKNEFGRHQLATIPDRQMQRLQAMLAQEDALVQFASTDFTIGDEVAVLGWGDGIKGNIVRIHGDKGQYVGVRINQLGCAYMEISPDRLIRTSKPKESETYRTK